MIQGAWIFLNFGFATQIQIILNVISRRASGIRFANEKMPDFCAAYGCSNEQNIQTRSCEITFHR